MNMVLDDDGKIIPRAEFRLNFLTVVEERLRKNLNQEIGPIVAQLGDMRRRYSRPQRWFYAKIDLNMKK